MALHELAHFDIHGDDVERAARSYAQVFPWTCVSYRGADTTAFRQIKTLRGGPPLPRRPAIVWSAIGPGRAAPPKLLHLIVILDRCAALMEPLFYVNL